MSGSSEQNRPPTQNKPSVTPPIDYNDDEPDSGTGDSDNDGLGQLVELHAIN